MKKGMSMMAKHRNTIQNPNDPKLRKMKTLSKEKLDESELNEEKARENINQEEINKEFRKRFKKYYLFRVKRTPCIEDLN